MKAIIFGSNGMLGYYLKKYISQKYVYVIPITRKEYDLVNLNEKSLDNLLRNCGIDENTVIINAAGVIPSSSKDQTERDFYKINSIFPILLSNIASKYKSKMIHITTDCVFSGNDGNYNENNLHDATDSYGISKSLGEYCNCTIIRTSIIGQEKYNKRSLLEWVIENREKEINGYANHYWNGVTCLELSKIIHRIITENLYWSGVRHIFTPEAVNKYQLLNMINEVYGLNITVNKFYTDKKIDKTISTVYETNSTFKIKNLISQVKELFEYKI
ncbi:dTDP-4-dehydrorhamnose reductase [Catovirus CTV1]|uniref:dTDP-4-dehydrorhamnose reductase n=1 Tax=Catovirus CTV1 TaxID=1977631 RepID=A0A1V0SAG7_9VIRU|nr:dTDP-4-dehydrorhamnose reductase [Catovirus CTV1]